MIKKQAFEDDTFLPPALSSYSIALLNEKSPPVTTTNNNVGSGLGDLNSHSPQVENERDDNTRDRLRHKLSVHFKEFEKLSSENIPTMLTNHSRSDSNTNSNSYTNTNSNSNNSHNISQTSINNLSGMSQDTNHSENLSESKFVVKRLRGRRFGKLLGPPQRKSIHDIVNDGKKDNKMELDRLSIDNLSNDNHSSNNKSNNSNNSNNSSNSNNNNINDNESKDNDNAKYVNDKMYDKYDNDKSNKENLFSNLNLSKDKEFELRNRIDYQKKLNDERKPLSDVSKRNSFIFNSNNKNLSSKYQDSPKTPINDFRKPKIPKLNSPKYNSPLKSLQKIESKVSLNLEQPELKPELQPPFNNEVNLPPSIIQSIQNRKESKDDDYKKRKTIGINGNQYEKLELLGRGGTSKVYKVKLLSNNKIYAIKKVTFDQFDDSCVQGFKGEIDLLIKLKNVDRVVKLIDYAIGETSIYLVLECGEIDLAHVLQARLNSLDLNFIKFNAIEILKCVNAVHSSDIVHSDLKPANFLFVKGILKIIDFGIANAVPEHTLNIYRDSQIGTPSYMAPEALIDIKQSRSNGTGNGTNSSVSTNTWKVGKPSDVWSCGCIIYQMIYGKPPFGGYSGNQRLMAIVNPQVKISYPTVVNNQVIPKSAIELMKNCLIRDPNERWTIEQCLNCDFLKPKIVDETFIRDLVHSSVNFGYNNRINGEGLPIDVYDKLVETVLKQIDELNL